MRFAGFCVHSAGHEYGGRMQTVVFCEAQEMPCFKEKELKEEVPNRIIPRCQVKFWFEEELCGGKKLQIFAVGSSEGVRLSNTYFC